MATMASGAAIVQAGIPRAGAGAGGWRSAVESVWGLMVPHGCEAQGSRNPLDAIPCRSGFIAAKLPAKVRAVPAYGTGPGPIVHGEPGEGAKPGVSAATEMAYVSRGHPPGISPDQ